VYRTLAVLVLTSVLSTSLSAQTLDDPIERARFQTGPIGLSPAIALTGFGVDTNVFNDFDDPRRDLTFTVSPMLDTWLRAGRSRLHVFTRTDLMYFHQYASERSVDGVVDSRFEVRGNRVTPWITAAAASGRQRWGYEIDLRYRRITSDLGAGVGVRVGSRTRVGVNARYSTYNHEPDALYLGSNLRELLDRNTTALGGEFRYALTALTTWVVSGEQARDRFVYTPARDANSWRIDTGFDLAPTALIAGRGRVGYRRFAGIGGDFPLYSGIVASVAATSRIRSRTQLEVTSARDVDYSWEPTYPYYVVTGAMLTVTPQLTLRWDVRARLGAQRFAYRAAVWLPSSLPDRVDRVGMLGWGVGYRLGPDVRVGIDIDREHRRSAIRLREYQGFRTGLSVTYGR
jgi:Putative beta-barrel porin 2